MPRKPTHPSRQRVPVAGHPGVYQRGDRYAVRYRDHRGAERQRMFRTLTEAKRFKATADSGDRQHGSRERFDRYADRWIESYVGRTAKGLDDGTREGYRDSLRLYAKPFLGALKLDQIDAPRLREYVEHLATHRRTLTSGKQADKPMSVGSVRRHFAVVRALLATAHEDGELATNPAYGFRVVVRGAKLAPSRPKRLSAAETVALLSALPVEHQDLACFLAATGVRISEAIAARWSDYSHEDGRPVLHIRESKTLAGVRTIPLGPELARRMTARRAAATYAADADPMFPSMTGTPIEPHNWRRRVFIPAREAAGLDWATPHMLRHGLASLMADSGSGAAEIAAHLGHADRGVTALRWYITPAMHEAPLAADALLARVAAGDTKSVHKVSTLHPKPAATPGG
jgi:integrase